MPKHFSLRVRCSLELYERISEFRHAGRFESRGQAMQCLIAAGLAALAKPVELPLTGSVADPVKPPPRRPKLVGFTGKEPREAYGSQSRADADV